MGNMQQGTGFVFHLDGAETEAIRALVDDLDFTYGNAHFDQVYWQCALAAAGLPSRLRRALLEMKALLSAQEGYLVVRGLPLPPELPPTPRGKPEPENQAVDWCRLLLVTLLSQVGFVYSFKGKVDENYVDSIFPIEADGQLQAGSNKTFLEWHIEDGFHQASADWVSLLCLRGDPAVETHIFPASAVTLPEAQMEQLYQPQYLLRSDFTFDGANRCARQVAVLSRHRSPEIVFDPAFMTSPTPEAQAALDALHALVNREKRSLVLAPGDLLLFDNRRTVHARSEYAPRYDGSDRWLLRGLVLESKFKARDCFPKEPFLAY